MEKIANTNAKNVFKDIELMGFCGFYYSLFDSDRIYNELLCEQEHYSLEYDIPTDEIEIDKDITFDEDKFQKDVINKWVEIYCEKMSDIIKSVSNVNMVSPAYYNFETDKIFVDIELVENWQDILRDFIAANFNELQKRIHDDWSDRSGFWSFIDNDIDNWMPYLFDDYHFDSRYLSIMLNYYLESKEENAIGNIEEEVYYAVEAYQYVELSDEFSEKIRKIQVDA